MRLLPGFSAAGILLSMCCAVVLLTAGCCSTNKASSPSGVASAKAGSPANSGSSWMPVCPGTEEGADAQRFYRPTASPIAGSIERDWSAIPLPRDAGEMPALRHAPMDGSHVPDGGRLAFGGGLSIVARHGWNVGRTVWSVPRASGLRLATAGRGRQFSNRRPSPACSASAGAIVGPSCREGLLCYICGKPRVFWQPDDTRPSRQEGPTGRPDILAGFFAHFPASPLPASFPNPYIRPSIPGISHYFAFFGTVAAFIAPASG